MPMYGPCSGWDPIYCGSWPVGSEAVTGYALSEAAEILWNQSAQQFGLCERTVRPCRRDCFGAFGLGGWWEWTNGQGQTWPQPLLYRGNWFNIACGSCPGSCSCQGIEEAKLPGPVNSVTQVLLGGSVMPTGSYRIDDDQMLVRTDGDLWPFCQDMSQPDDGADAWAVTAVFGVPVPVSGRQAVGELALEIANACRGIECRLPPNVQSLARQGITIQFDDPNQIRSRLYFAGMFLNTYNPDDYRTSARAFDVDGPGYRRVGTA